MKSVTIGGRAVGLTKSNVQPKVGETGFVNIVHIVSAIKKGGFPSTKYSCFCNKNSVGRGRQKAKRYNPIFEAENKIGEEKR